MVLEVGCGSKRCGIEDEFPLEALASPFYDLCNFVKTFKERGNHGEFDVEECYGDLIQPNGGRRMSECFPAKRPQPIELRKGENEGRSIRMSSSSCCVKP